MATTRSLPACDEGLACEVAPGCAAGLAATRLPPAAGLGFVVEHRWAP
jgi:hypothetical protein